ncbi:hypothetical protein AB3N02_22030 [Priestia aryabhattai]|uniref:hypothetical protein n=1 Tax=Priestia aryabhattai TaxID=412384 RepID=UPI0039A1B730
MINYEKLDKIVLTEKEMQHILEWDRENHHRFDSITFPLSEGVIEVEHYLGAFMGHNFDMHVTTLNYFKINEEYIEFKQFDKTDMKELISFKLDETFGDDGQTKYRDLKTNIPRATEKDTKGQADMMVFSTLCVFQYMTRVTHTVKEAKESKVIKKKQKSKKASGTNKNRVTRINTTRYTFDFERTSSGNYERHTPAWTVRGHWREYKKTGKRVWVKPHVKGEGEVLPKVYKP